MSAWRGPEGDGRERAKLAFVAGGGLGLLAVAWIMLSRPGEERLPSQGFDARGSGGVAAPTFRETREQSGLSFVRLPDEPAPAAVPGTTPAASAPAAPATVAPAPAAPSAPVVPAPAAPVPTEADRARLRALGAPEDARGLSRLGAQRGLLSGLVAKALAHPAVLGLLLNNKTLVDAYFSRDLVKRNCESGAALQAYLANGSDPNGVSEEAAIARQLLQNPAAASAAVGTEFGRRLTSCPSVGQLASSPGAVLQIATANPALLGLVSDPNAAGALASNPQALSLLSGAQSSLGGGARAP